MSNTKDSGDRRGTAMEDFVFDEISLLIGVVIGLIIGITATLLVLLIIRRRSKSKQISFERSAAAENTEDCQIHSEMNFLYGAEELQDNGLHPRAVFRHGNSCSSDGQSHTMLVKNAETQTDFNYDYAIPHVSESFNYERERGTYHMKGDLNNHLYENGIHAMYQNIFKSLFETKMESCPSYENAFSKCDNNSNRKRKVRTNEKSAADISEYDIGSMSDNSDSIYVEPNSIASPNTEDSDSDSDEKEEVDGKLMDYANTLRKQVPKRSVSECVRSPRQKSPKVCSKSNPNKGGYVMMEISPDLWKMINTRQRRIARAQSNPVTPDDDPYLKMYPVLSRNKDETYIELIS